MRISDWSSDVCSSDLSAFLGAQLGIAGETLAAYAVRRQTRHQHMEALRRIYGYRMFPGRGPYARAFRDWLLAEAEQARSNDDLRSEEHTSELQSLMRISYAVFCLKKKKHKLQPHQL